MIVQRPRWASNVYDDAGSQVSVRNRDVLMNAQHPHEF